MRDDVHVARQLWPGSLRAACKKLALQHQASMCALDTKAKQDAALHAISLPCSTMHRCVLSTPRQSKMLTCMQEACLAAPGIVVCFRHQGKQDVDLHARSLPCSTRHRCVLSPPRQSKMLPCMQEACLAAPGIDVCYATTPMFSATAA